MLGSKYLIVKDGTGLECSEDREEQRQIQKSIARLIAKCTAYVFF